MSGKTCGKTFHKRRILQPSRAKLADAISFAAMGGDFPSLTTVIRPYISCVRILISDVSVLCTGHFSAISRSRVRCSSVSGPSIRI